MATQQVVVVLSEFGKLLDVQNYVHNADSASILGGPQEYYGDESPPASVRETVALLRDRATSDAAREGPIEKAIRNLIVNHVVSETGASEADVRQAVAKVQASSGHPLLDFLKSGAFLELIQLVIAALAMFGVKSPLPPPAAA